MIRGENYQSHSDKVGLILSVRKSWKTEYPKNACEYKNIILTLSFSLSDDRQYINLLRILQDLYRLGFRVISQEVNMVVGADKNGIYNFLEIVFMKETWSKFDILNLPKKRIVTK